MEISRDPAAPYGGVLNLDKPAGATSFRAVQQVRRILGEKRVGHCGTLDPMATGVLVVLFGNATAWQDRLMAGRKTYRARMRLGVATDTGDATGKVVRSGPVPVLSESGILAAFLKFTGEIEQFPPMYSAVKLRGRRLYQYARAGVEVPREPRKVTIFSLELIGFGGDGVDFRVACSKGTYVRSLAEDLGGALGAPATLASLVREQAGPFRLEDSLSWSRLERMSRAELLAAARPPETFAEVSPHA